MGPQPTSDLRVYLCLSHVMETLGTAPRMMSAARTFPHLFKTNAVLSGTENRRGILLPAWAQARAEGTPEPEETAGTPTLGRCAELGAVSVAPGSDPRPGGERGLDLGTGRGCVAKVGFLSTDGSTGFRDSKKLWERSAGQH